MATGSSLSPRQAFERAKARVVPFGKYKGLTLNQIADNDEGLLYLDWLVGQDWLRQETMDDLRTFLDYDPVARDLTRLVEEREERRSR